MKIRGLFKKAAATLMAAVTALSILPATTAFAAGDIGTISFSHTYDSSGNAMRYNSSATFDGHTAGGTGNYKYRMFVDGENAFCIQPGVPLKTGNTLKQASSDTWNALSANQKKAVGLALLYGYQGNRSNLTGSDDEKWVATQTLVWEFVTGCREATGPFSKTNDKVYSLHFGSNYANSGAKAAYDQIVSLMSGHHTIPSFMSGSKNGITKELAYKDGKYTLTFTDSNGVLSDYAFSSSDSKVSVSKSGNKLTISSAKAFDGTVRITATRNNVPTVSSSAKLIAYGDPNLQDLVTGVENADTVAAYINVETPTGTIALKKTSEDGVVEGIQFTIKGKDFNQTVKTDKNGNITVAGLVPDTYTITEQAIDKYEPQQTQTVTLIGGKTTTVTFSNVLKRGSLEVVKTSEDNLVEGVKFHLYGTSLSGYPVDEYAVTNAKGVAKFENVLISGNTPYTLEEVDTAIRYVVPASQTAPIEWNKVTNRSFHNILKKFNVTVTKTDAETGKPQGDASLAGAVYGIYKGEELIDTYTTDANGQFTTKYYICDNDWTIREISPSEGYLLDTTIHKVGAEPELYTVELNSTENAVNEQVIKGNISIIKHTDNGETQIETPEEGAVFEVYLKAAGSYEAAKETERDMLTCDENGFAQSKDMPYGIYTVKQTSGWEGRELMKPFDVFINQDGQTYRYLINNANFESYIKIVKKDAETGKTIPYAGAGFQIYDPSGSLVSMTFTYPEVTTIDTFYTTADGDLITPQTLEYGKGYSLVEVQAPYGYVLNSEPVYFDVMQENSEEESGITVIEVVRSNMAQKGTITVTKSGEMFSTVAGDKGLYQPIFSVGNLEGAVYEIRAAEDIYTLDGTLRASKGEVVDTVTTGKDGTAKSKELYLGKYEVNRMMEDIKSGKDGVSYVLVFKLSRFGRNAADVLSTLQVMQDFDVNLICVEDGIDSSKDAGKLMISVLSAVAEIERENIRVQTMEGRIQKAREGKWNGGFAPYGYKLEKGMLYINEEEAEAIRIIFDQYVHTDIGANGLAKYLANHGINKIQRQNGKNPLFDAALIRRILKNPVYCGKIAYGRRRTEKVHGTRNDYRLVEQENYLLVDGLHEAIVSEGLWHEAQVKLLAQAKKYEKVNNGKDNKVHLLTGLLKCPICGAGMYGNKSIKHKPDGTKYKDFFYYGCKHRTMTRGHKCEYKKQINEELLDGAVAEVIIKLVSNPKFAAMMQQKINMKIDTSAIEQEIANYEKQLRQSYATKSRLIDEIDTLDPDDKHYIKRKADLDDRLYKMYDKIEDTENLLIEARAKKMAIEAEKLTADNIYKVLIYFEKLYAVMDEQEKRQIMESLISEIHIYEERQPNGQWLKSIKFKLPIIEEDMEMSLDSDTHVEAVCLLTKE